MSNEVDIWMLIEENKEFTEFGCAVSPLCYVILQMCRLHNQISDFLDVFLRASFSKCSMKMLVITREIGEPIVAPEVYS